MNSSFVSFRAAICSISDPLETSDPLEISNGFLDGVPCMSSLGSHHTKSILSKNIILTSILY